MVKVLLSFVCVVFYSLAAAAAGLAFNIAYVAMTGGGMTAVIVGGAFALLGISSIIGAILFGYMIEMEAKEQ